MFMAALIQFVPFQSYLLARANKPWQFLVLLSFALFYLGAHRSALFLIACATLLCEFCRSAQDN
jgi:hypothetical protein